MSRSLSCVIEQGVQLSHASAFSRGMAPTFRESNMNTFKQETQATFARMTTASNTCKRPPSPSPPPPRQHLPFHVRPDNFAVNRIDYLHLDRCSNRNKQSCSAKCNFNFAEPRLDGRCRGIRYTFNLVRCTSYDKGFHVDRKPRLFMSRGAELPIQCTSCTVDRGQDIRV